MMGTDPHLLAAVTASALSLLAIGCSAFTWFTSRAQKVRAIEDQVLTIVRSYQVKVSQMETQLADWKVTIQSILSEVEDFFERTTKERKRIQAQNQRAEQMTQNNQPVDMSQLPRDAQMAEIRQHFAGR